MTREKRFRAKTRPKHRRRPQSRPSREQLDAIIVHYEPDKPIDYAELGDALLRLSTGKVLDKAIVLAENLNYQSQIRNVRRQAAPDADDSQAYS
jgi:hypothetical protein